MEAPVKSKIPRPRGRMKQSQAAITEQAVQLSATILAILNGMAGATICEEARMTRGEQKMIADPLQRILERLDIEASEKVGTYSDPVLLFLGLLTWGSRLFRLKKEKSEEDHKENQTDETTVKDDPDKELHHEKKSDDENMPTGHDLPKPIRNMIDNLQTPNVRDYK